VSARLFARPAPPATLLVRRAHALDPRGGLDEPADVLVRDGEIAEIAAPGAIDAPAGAEAIDAEGAHLLPAFVDPHVHLRTPGQEHKEDIATGTAAAAAGGYCAIAAMPNTDPVVHDATGLRALAQAAGRDAAVPTGFFAAITRGLAGEELTEMAELRDAGALGFTDDGMPVYSAGMLRRALQYQRLCGGVLALHEEDPTLSGSGVMHEGPVSAALGLAGIPPASESTMVARDATLAAYEDGRVHFQHLSCAGSVAALAAARADGARVSGEVSPHHLTLTDEAVRSLDSRFKMNPPLRTEEDRLALLDALRSGTIEIVATDHAPHARHEKEVPFEAAPMGTTGLETAFAVLHTELVVPGSLPLGVLIERMTAGAALLEMAPPRIEAGAPANLVLADLEEEWVAGEGGYVSRSENCCFGGRRLRGRVLATIAAGTVAHRAQSLARRAAGAGAAA